MRFSLTYVLGFVAAVSALVVERDFDSASKEIDAIANDVNNQIISTNLENGLQRLDIIVDGIYEGYLVQTEDGGVQVFDENDKEIQLDEIAAEDAIEKRQRAQILIRLAKLIAKFGQKAWRFLNCVGFTTALLNCAGKFADCGIFGDAPQDCIAGLACLGTAGYRCRNA